MQESMNRDGIGCSQNLVLDTPLERIKLTDLGEMTDCRPENMRTFLLKLLKLTKLRSSRGVLAERIITLISMI